MIYNEPEQDRRNGIDRRQSYGLSGRDRRWLLFVFGPLIVLSALALATAVRSFTNPSNPTIRLHSVIEPAGPLAFCPGEIVTFVFKADARPSDDLTIIATSWTLVSSGNRILHNDPIFAPPPVQQRTSIRFTTQIPWLDDRGERLAPGAYRFNVTAQDLIHRGSTLHLDVTLKDRGDCGA